LSVIPVFHALEAITLPIAISTAAPSNVIVVSPALGVSTSICVTILSFAIESSLFDVPIDTVWPNTKLAPVSFDTTISLTPVPFAMAQGLTIL